jgi:nitroreductase
MFESLPETLYITAGESLIFLLAAASGELTPAGFSQGWGFLVLDSPAGVARFRETAAPEQEPEAFGVPAQFYPIGAISVGYSDEPPRDLRSRRKPRDETVHRGRWNQPVG